MIDAQSPAQQLARRCAVSVAAAIRQRPGRGATHLEAVEVVHGEHGAPLIFVRHEAEALGLARVPVPHEIDVDDLAVLGHDGDHVAFGQVEGQPAHVDVRRVLRGGVR